MRRWVIGVWLVAGCSRFFQDTDPPVPSETDADTDSDTDSDSDSDADIDADTDADTDTDSPHTGGLGDSGGVGDSGA